MLVAVGVTVGDGAEVRVALGDGVGLGSGGGLTWPGEGLGEETQTLRERGASWPCTLAREWPGGGGEKPGSQRTLW